MDNNLVTVIIPTYKTNESLRRAIDSVKKQTYKNIEVVVVDDNDPNSLYRKKAEEIIKCFENVEYIKHEKNRNGSAARNTGLKRAKGNFICFLDDDDFFYSDKIKKQIEFLKENNFHACTCFYKKNNEIIKFKPRQEYISEILMNENAPQTSSLMIKKVCIEKLNGFDESYSRHQDYEFLLRFFEKYKMGVIEDCLYEMGNNGVNNAPNAKKMEQIKDKFLRQFTYLINENNLNRKKIYAKNYACVIYFYIKGKDLKNGLRVLKKTYNIYTLFYLIQRFNIGIKSITKGHIKKLEREKNEGNIKK